ncbi:restriction endonuclease subunit S [Glycomyces sp. L485]|uniref:restriction endonuclease subunit S n=1 Tax=Glycomyces sp. L485 TaxID=2909235 RepID=UPI001F4A39AB|nr:restriction endonuclease subunit S [Glycomyces sp. L485]MCH7231888.1 restriction endonuclease subunit S [Glycomyces sp. L485]
MRWNEYNLSDLVQIFDGPHATPHKTEIGPYFLSISSLKDGRLDLSESAHLSEDEFIKWTRRVTPEPGDLLFSYETRLGQAALMIPGIRACLGRRMGLLRPDRSKVMPKFLLLAYLAPEFQYTIRSRAIHGATVDRIPLKEMSTWPIRIPSLGEQEVVCEVIGALDDKIASNDRIAVTIEKILSLKFEQLRMTDANGNESIPVSELIDFNPRESAPKVSSAPYIDMAALSTDRARISSIGLRQPKSGTKFRNGDTLLARITPCLENGKTGFVDSLPENEIGLGSTEFIVMRPKSGVPEQLPYFIARNETFRDHAIRNMEGTSGRQRVSAAKVAGFLVRVPDSRALGVFGEESMRSFQYMKALGAESRTLAELRDTLLPRLMSGEIRVGDAEKIVEDVT